MPTWDDMGYVCLIIDAFRRKIVGWRVAAHMRTQMVLDAVEMARCSRGARLEGLIAHSDTGRNSLRQTHGEPTQSVRCLVDGGWLFWDCGWRGCR